MLLTVLLVLAILASSALVFTDRVELLKLAVILALWAAVVAAFVSVIYRRQSDLDQAKARDLKLVYDLQLDREISARREYELTVETELRRELASELRAQADDEVAALRAELAALRTNLEILFDTDLAHRPAIETDMTKVRAAGRVTASRLDIPDVEVTDIRTEESPIIDVPAVPHLPENEWPAPIPGGAHRLSSQPAPAPEQPRRRRRRPDEQPAARRPQSPPQAPQPQMPQPHMPPPPAPQPPRRPMPEPRQPEPRQPEPTSAWAPPPPPPAMPPMAPSPTLGALSADSPEPQQDVDWQPAPAEGQWIPAGAPGSNWEAPGLPPSAEADYIGRRRAPDQLGTPVPEPAPAPEPVPVPEPPVPAAPEPEPESLAESPAQPEPAMSVPPRGRHSSGDPNGLAGPQPGPVLAAEPSAPPPVNESRHRRPAEPEPEVSGGNHEDGQSAAELLARFQTTPTEGGRRRRREE